MGVLSKPEFFPGIIFCIGTKESETVILWYHSDIFYILLFFHKSLS